MNTLIENVDNFIAGPYFLIPILVGAGVCMTFWLGWIHFRGSRDGLALISGEYDNPQDAGEITHFQVLLAALSATLGIGNIAGVATAVHLVGPGAVVWMWVTAIFGMSLKFSRGALALRHRIAHRDGSAGGGPRHFIEGGLGRKWKPLAVAFAVCAAIASLGIGNVAQSNTVGHNLSQCFNIPKILTGLLLAILVWLVIMGGVRRIGQVACRLVPSMCFLYLLGGLIVLFLHV